MILVPLIDRLRCREPRYKDEEDPVDSDDGYRDQDEERDHEPYRDVAEPTTDQGPLLHSAKPPRDATTQSFDADLEAGDEQDMMLQHRNIMDGTSPPLPSPPKTNSPI